MAGRGSTKGATILILLFFGALLAIGVITIDVSPVHLGYNMEVQGVLKMETHPALAEQNPTLLVYTLQTDGGAVLYLTENGIPLGALAGFWEGIEVGVRGVTFKRSSHDGKDSYIMLEIFIITRVVLGG